MPHMFRRSGSYINKHILADIEKSKANVRRCSSICHWPIRDKNYLKNVTDSRFETIIELHGDIMSSTMAIDNGVCPLSGDAIQPHNLR